MSIQKSDPILHAKLKVADIYVEPPGKYGVSSAEAVLQRLGV